MTARPAAVRGISDLSVDQARETVSTHDPAARIEALYVEHFTAVYRYLVLTGSTPADADEIVQESFLRLLNTLTRGQSIEKPRQWLVSVAHNLRVAEVHKAARTAEAEQNSTLDEALTQEQVLLQTERMRRLNEAMSRLTSRQRDYLYLRAEGLRLKEIAEIHGVTIQTVAEACSRAIRILGKLSNE